MTIRKRWERDAPGLLAHLSTAELINVVAAELDARPELQIVQSKVTTLLTLAPTLTDRAHGAQIGTRLVDDAVEEATIESAARAHLLDHPMLTAGQVAEALHRSASDRSVASRLRREGEIVGVPVGNSYRYPAFQFDETTASVRPEVAEVNALLGAHEDPWGVASWWLSPSARLPEGHCPADLAVDADPKVRARVLRLASAVVAD